VCRGRGTRIRIALVQVRQLELQVADLDLPVEPRGLVADHEVRFVFHGYDIGHDGSHPRPHLGRQGGFDVPDRELVWLRMGFGLRCGSGRGQGDEGHEEKENGKLLPLGADAWMWKW